MGLLRGTLHVRTYLFVPYILLSSRAALPPGKGTAVRFDHASAIPIWAWAWPSRRLTIFHLSTGIWIGGKDDGKGYPPPFALADLENLPSVISKEGPRDLSMLMMDVLQGFE